MFDYGYLSKERQSLMGAMIIWIIFFHSSIDCSAFSVLVTIKRFGNLGVDVFLLLSGIGLYFSSYKLSSDIENGEIITWILTFYKNRLIRILPSTIMCLLPWYLYLYHGKHVSIFRFILDITSLSYWIDGNNRGWYISLTIVLYIIYPILFFTIVKNRKCFWGILIIVLDIAFNSMIAAAYSEWFENVNLALCRIPVFIFGCLVAPSVKQKKSYSLCGLVMYILTAVFLFWFLNNHLNVVKSFGIWRYLYGILAFCVTLILSVAFHFIHCTWIFRIFKFCGKYTLEIYLTHTQILTVFEQQLSGILSRHIINILAVFCSVILAVLIHEILLGVIKQAIEKRINL